MEEQPVQSLSRENAASRKAEKVARMQQDLLAIRKRLDTANDPKLKRELKNMISQRVRRLREANALVPHYGRHKTTVVYKLESRVHDLELENDQLRTDLAAARADCDLFKRALKRELNPTDYNG